VDDEKLLLTSRALRLRRLHPEWFGGEYEPARVTGPAAAHAVAFLRGPGRVLTLATRLPVGLERRDGWATTDVAVPEGRWRDRLTGRVHEAEGRLRVADLLAALPAALLVREERR
jgi:(1->4)-alpha-D-glucan 1-alpha-D-glucosylmutase